MNRPKLYLFIGAPGAGKTTIAKLIAEHSGAVHLWADAERHKMFDKPTHSKDESLKLYDHLNEDAAALLKNGQSVVFDTNFNFYDDRQKLRHIADRAGAETIIIWLVTPDAIARERSVHTPSMRNGYPYGMTSEQFDSIISKLEPPREEELVIKLDGAKVEPRQVMEALHLIK